MYSIFRKLKIKSFFHSYIEVVIFTISQDNIASHYIEMFGIQFQPSSDFRK